MGNYLYNSTPPPSSIITNQMLVDVLDKYKQKLEQNDHTLLEFMRVMTLYLADKNETPTLAEFSDEQIMQFFTLGWYINEVKQTNLDFKKI